MEKYLNVLKKCPLLNNINENDLPILTTCLGAKILSFDKKQTIIDEGSTPKYIGIVLSGSVQVIQINFYGTRSILNNIEQSQIFAEAFACAEIKTMPVTVIANEPSTVMLIEYNKILHTCSKVCGFHQQLIFNLMKNLANKTLMFHQKIEVISKRSTRDKLMTYLLLQAKKAKNNSFEIPFDRQELADYLEVDRSGLSAEISKLRLEGILESNKKHFKLLKNK